MMIDAKRPGPRALFDDHPTPMYVADPRTWRILYANKAAARFYGYPLERWPRLTIFDLRPRSEVPKLRRYLKTRRIGVPRKGLWMHRKRDGTVVQVRVTSKQFVHDGHKAELVVIDDVTELLEAQRGLARFRGLWEKVLQNAPDFIFTLDPRGVIQTINRVGPGYDRGQVVGKNALAFIPRSSHPRFRRQLARVFAGETVDFQNEAYKADGSAAVYEYRMAPLFEGEAVSRAICIARDTTERRRTEAALHHSRQLLDSIVRNAPDLVTTLDRDLVITYCNRFTMGYVQGDVVGRHVAELCAPKDRARMLAKLRRVIARGAVENYETEAIGADGRRHWHRTHVGPLRSGRRITGAVAVSTEITEWKLAQEQLAEAQSRLQGLFNTSRDGLTFVDFRGRFIDVNPAFCRLVGYSRDELRRMSVYQVTAPEHRAKSTVATEYLMRTGKPYVFDKEYLRKDGSRIPGSVTTYTVKGPNGRPSALAGVVRDMTERRRLEREILEIGAREQTRLGRELHDSLGQELTGISLLARSLAQRLAQTGGPELEQARRIAETARLAVEQVRGLAAGLMPLELVPNGLPAALRELGARAERLFGIACAVQAPVSLPRLDDFHLVHLFRIAQEALTNAAKHGRARNAAIDLQARDGRLTLTITDDGVGFTASKSAGLGLRILRRRAEMLGGRIAISRAHGRGTLVSCDVPVPSQTARLKKALPPVKGGRADARQRAATSRRARRL